MVVFTILFLLGSSLSISAQNWRWWTAATSVSKIGLGIAQTTLIVYLAECAPFQLRGTAMATYQLFLAGGQLIGAIGTQIQTSISDTAWRPLIASEFVITGVEFSTSCCYCADQRSFSAACSRSFLNPTSITSEREMRVMRRRACCGYMAPPPIMIW